MPHGIFMHPVAENLKANKLCFFCKLSIMYAEKVLLKMYLFLKVSKVITNTSQDGKLPELLFVGNNL